MNSIKVEGISKSFGMLRALDGISLELREARIYGLLGRNGAGKSTLLNSITNRIFADAGTVRINGRLWTEPDAQAAVHLMSEAQCYPGSERILESMRWAKRFSPGFDMDYAATLAVRFGLDTSKKPKALSTGYGSIFKIIMALASDADFLLFDEPVLGLDANHRDLFYRLLLENYARRPRCIVISTHLIEEISNVIEHIFIINHGQLTHSEDVEALLASGYAVSGARGAVESFTAGKKVIGEDALGGLKTAYILGTADKSALPSGLELSKLDLQRLFIQLTNGQGREDA